MSEGENVSLSWWGDVTAENYKETVANNDRMKTVRVDLFKTVLKILTDFNVNFWIDCGTLLGAFRNGKMIPHDCDTDFAVFGKDQFFFAEAILEKQLPAHLKLKSVNDYCRKFEVYDIKFPQEPWGDSGSTWSPVSCDIYLYQFDEHQFVRMEYFKFGFTQKLFKKEWIFPKGHLMFEGVNCPVPHSTRLYLQEMYGYLGTDFFHDNASNRFMKKGTKLIKIINSEISCPICNESTKIPILSPPTSENTLAFNCTKCKSPLAFCTRCSSSTTLSPLVLTTCPACEMQV
jgi:hypothetical protein